jgi:uncharacterized UBP type Zn finger protein
MEPDQSDDVQLYKVKPFGLINPSNNCYFNSLMQFMLTCNLHSELKESYANIDRKIKNNETVLNVSLRNKLGSVYDETLLVNSIHDILKYLIDILKLAGALIKDGRYNDIPKTGVPSMSTFVLKKLSITNIDSIRRLITGQQSVCEVFILLVELLGLEEMFKIVHVRDIRCYKCSYKNRTEVISYHYNAFDESVTDFSTRLKTDMLGEESDIDYVCECGAKKVNSKIWLKETSDNIVVIFNKFSEKKDLRHPTMLTFDTAGSFKIVYQLAAQIEHIGDAHHGHYITLTERDNEVFLCDDDRIIKLNGKLQSTANTYMVLYKKIYDSADIDREKQRILGNKYRLIENDIFRYREEN